MNYFEPSPIWTSMGITDKDNHVIKNVLNGRFHKNVPEDVVESYKTVEYLMAHSYYYWPLYDEALKKVLHIFEMAVKLRCQELKISLKFTNKKSVTKDRILADLISDIIVCGLPTSLKTSLDWVRELRNLLSHPDRNSFGGGIFKQQFYPIINLINQLFIPIDWYERQGYESSNLKSQSEQFKESLFVLPYDGKKILVFNVMPLETLWLKKEWIHFWNFIPILNNPNKMASDNYFVNPINLVLKNIEIMPDGLVAIDYFTEDKIEILKTTKLENVSIWDEYKTEYIDQLNKFPISYDSHVRSIASQRLEEFIYETCWGQNDFNL